jgi:hypothetical protein
VSLYTGSTSSTRPESSLNRAPAAMRLRGRDRTYSSPVISPGWPELIHVTVPSVTGFGSRFTAWCEVSSLCMASPIRSLSLLLAGVTDEAWPGDVILRGLKLRDRQRTECFQALMCSGP